MVKWAIVIAAYVAGCIWLSVRRMEAAGTGPKTPRGRLRELRWAIVLLALTVTGFGGLFGPDRWTPLGAMAAAGLVLVLRPRQAAHAAIGDPDRAGALWLLAVPAVRARLLRP